MFIYYGLSWLSCECADLAMTGCFVVSKLVVCAREGNCSHVQQSPDVVRGDRHVVLIFQLAEALSH